MNESNELDILHPAPHSVRVGGETVEVFPLKGKQLGPVLRALAPVRALLQAGGAWDEGFWWVALAEHDEAIRTALARAIDKDVSIFDEADLLEIVDVALAVVAVNRDFFIRMAPARVAKAVALLLEMVAKLVPPGQIPISGSGPEASIPAS